LQVEKDTRLRRFDCNIHQSHYLPIGNKPFILHLLNYLKVSGFRKIALSLCYQPNAFIKELSEAFPELKYHTEQEPLGTGGGILHSLQYIDTEWIIILNGDSVLDIDYAKFAHDNKTQYTTSVVIACNEVKQQNRYGFVTISNNLVTGFEEKPREPKNGLINAGIYFVKKDSLSTFKPKSCSFESDILPVLIKKGQVTGVKFAEKFIDIGTPDDYSHAEYKLKEMKNFKGII